MNKKLKLLIMILSLILCIVVTFAWINEIEQINGRYLQFLLEGENAVIASTELSVRVYKDATGEDDYEEITHILEEGDTTPLTHFSNFAPGSRQKFRADITNNGTSPLYVRMVLSDIVCENEELQQNLVMGTSGFEGFRAPYLPPALTSNTMLEGIDNGSFMLMENAEIPPSTTISVYFYLLFSSDATESVSNLDFTVGSINFLVV